MDRRDLLKSLVGLTAGLTVSATGVASQSGNDTLGEILPTRKLGRTGEQVTMLGLGGHHIGWTTERDAEETIRAAIEGGIRFFDTAESYSDGVSEERYGKYLTPQYRDQVFLMTKSRSDDVETARKHLEGSLNRLNTDYLDLWQVHSVQSRADVDKRQENGVFKVMQEAKEEGLVRYIGFTGHKTPAAHQRVLEMMGRDTIFDTVQMPVNVLDFSYHSFIENVMPIALDRSMGILAMKTLADGRFFQKKVQEDRVKWETEKPVIPDKISIEEALQFVWSLPVSVIITGAENAELLREKIAIAKSFVSLDEEKRIQLADRVRDLAETGEYEYYKDV